MEFSIIPECYIDTALIESILCTFNPKIKGVNHQKGCNTVANVMINKFKNDFAIGIIDDDKRKHQYVDDFNIISSTEHIKVLKHHSNYHLFVIITPEMDKFILDCAKKEGVNMKDFNLPNDLKSFIKITKSIETKKDVRFTQLFKKLKNNKEIKCLRNFFEYILQHKYNNSSHEIKEKFQ